MTQDLRYHWFFSTSHAQKRRIPVQSHSVKRNSSDSPRTEFTRYVPVAQLKTRKKLQENGRGDLKSRSSLIKRDQQAHLRSEHSMNSDYYVTTFYPTGTPTPRPTQKPTPTPTHSPTSSKVSLKCQVCTVYLFCFI